MLATAEATAAPAETEDEAPNYAGLYQKIMDDVRGGRAEAFVACLNPGRSPLAKRAEADPGPRDADGRGRRARGFGKRAGE